MQKVPSLILNGSGKDLHNKKLNFCMEKNTILNIPQKNLPPNIAWKN